MAKPFFTVIAIVAVLYGFGFLLIPELLGQLYGAKPDDPNALLNIRFFGSALLSLGAIYWFARDFGDWAAVRGVLIGSLAANIVGAAINVWATAVGLLNSVAWSSAAVQLLLVAGALYCLAAGPRKPA